MFYVWSFTFDIMFPVFIEIMIIKHSRINAVLWGHSFLVICVHSRTKFGKSILMGNPERWFLSLHQLYNSETVGFASHHEPPGYSKICVFFQSDRCNFHTPFEFP